MTNAEAAEILISLAEKQTDPRIIGALFIGANALGSWTIEKPLRIRDERINDRSRQGHAWTGEEETELKAQFTSGQGVYDIAQAHQRSCGAIRSRLEKLGLLHWLDYSLSRLENAD